MSYTEKTQEAIGARSAIFDNMMEAYAYHEMIFNEYNVPVDYRFLDVNQMFCKLTGLAENIIGRTVREVLPGIEDKWLQAYGRVVSEQITVEFEDYSSDIKRFFKVKAYPVGKTGFVSLFFDVTDAVVIDKKRKEYEDQISRSQRLSALGTLAGGIAHDFNNVLAPIIGYTDMAMANLAHDDPLAEDLSLVLKSAFKAKDMINQILLFSRQGECVMEPQNIAKIIEDGLVILKRSFPSSIKIEFSAEKPIRPVNCNTTQIHQILVNLCTNSWHAMEPGGGRIRLRILNADGSKIKDIVTEGTSGRFVCLSVSDEGCGMDSETMSRIFEPFYTTKQVDKGNGLGLSVTYGIVKNHNGHIQVQSQPGSGTTIEIFFPACLETAIIDPHQDEELPSGSERIMTLLSDVSASVSLESMLEALGYSTDRFMMLTGALEHFMDDPEYDLIIMDSELTTGINHMQDFSVINSRVRFLLLGAEDNCIEFSQALPEHRVSFLKKPFSLKDVAYSVRNALNNDKQGRYENTSGR